MGKEFGARLSRRLWRGGNTSPLKMTAWEIYEIYSEMLTFFMRCTLTLMLIKTQIILSDMESYENDKRICLI